MEAVDYAIILLVALSTVTSLFRGFFREAISLGTWVDCPVARVEIRAPGGGLPAAMDQRCCGASVGRAGTHRNCCAVCRWALLPGFSGLC